MQLTFCNNKNLYVDHIDKDNLNNNLSNLRLCTNQQNGFNSLKWRSKTSSKYKGVTFDSSRKKWISQINIDRKHIYIGRFKCEKRAALEYDKMASKLFGEFANLNFENFDCLK